MLKHNAIDLTKKKIYKKRKEEKGLINGYFIYFVNKGLV